MNKYTRKIKSANIQRQTNNQTKEPFFQKNHTPDFFSQKPNTPFFQSQIIQAKLAKGTSNCSDNKKEANSANKKTSAGHPIYGENGTLIKYLVGSGQGPTQIAEDLNQNYSCELTCYVDWTQIVYDNAIQFQNIFDGKGNIDDKYNGDYKSGNIEPGDILIITAGKKGGEFGDKKQQLQDNIAAKDNYQKQADSIGKARLDFYNNPINSHEKYGSEPSSGMQIWRTYNGRKSEKAQKQKKRKVDSLNNVIESQQNELDSLENKIVPVKG